MNEYDEDLLFPTKTASTEDLSSEEAKFLISLMTWSFSRLNSYYHCPFEWKIKYLLGRNGIGSFFSEYGKYIHEIHEKYLKNKIGLFELPMYYEEHYVENVIMTPPPNRFTDLGEKYYEQGSEYFNNFDWDLDNYELLGIEKEIRFEYKGYEFVGFIDYLLRDKSDGKIIIGDHKSAILKTLKNGKISKSDQKHFEEFKRQLYLYSHQIMEEYGDDSVKELQWNMFRDGKKLTIPWKRDEYEASMKWVIDTIHLIENDVSWLPSKEFQKAQEEKKYPPFYCIFLCSNRHKCPYKNQLIDALKMDERMKYEFI